MIKKKVSRFARYSWTVVAVLALTSLLFVGVGFVPQWWLGFASEPGTFGDSFGFVNSLFSAFAFAGLLITLLIQINEFHLAQEERRESIEVQKQISDQHAKDLEVQKQISDQQYLASIISTISTWQQMNPDVPKPMIKSIKATHLAYAKQRYLNNVLLALTQRHMLDGLTPSEASSLLDRVRRDPTYSVECQIADMYERTGLLVMDAYASVREKMRQDYFDKDYSALLQDFAHKVVGGYCRTYQAYHNEGNDRQLRGAALRFFTTVGRYFHGMKITSDLGQELTDKSFNKIVLTFVVNVLREVCIALHYE